jgi:hypothetical protein
MTIEHFAIAALIAVILGLAWLAKWALNKAHEFGVMCIDAQRVTIKAQDDLIEVRLQLLAERATRGEA